MVCRRRMGMKKMRHVNDGSRPSLECHSIVDSIQLTSVTTFTEQGSKPSFAYYNPALHIGDPSKVRANSYPCHFCVNLQAKGGALFLI